MGLPPPGTDNHLVLPLFLTPLCSPHSHTATLPHLQGISDSAVVCQVVEGVLRPGFPTDTPARYGESVTPRGWKGPRDHTRQVY